MRRFFLLLVFWLITPFLQAKPCDDIPKKLHSYLKPGNILLFGEFHGTNEMPKKFFDVICNANNLNIPVQIALEAPFADTKLYQSFITTAENDFKTSKLLSNGIWAQNIHDGRNSQAMLKLLKNIRKARSKNHKIQIFTFDQTGKNRDKLMAKKFLKQLSPKALVLALIGNLHSRTTHGAPWDKNFKTMGGYIKKNHSQTFSIRFYGKGEA